MRNTIIGGMLGVLAVASVAGATTYVNRFWNGQVNYALPVSPCPSSHKVTGMVPLVAGDGYLWVFYNCEAYVLTGNSGEDTVQRATRFTDPSTLIAGPVVPPLVPTYTGFPGDPNCTSGPRPGIGWVCQDGGWLPPDHPAIRR